MNTIKADLCIIGAGSGGLSIAAGAAQMGASVVLLEADKMGGDCLNYGCVPSKALLAAGKAAHAMTQGAKFGITPVVPEIDFAAAKDHVAKVIETIAPVDSQERFEGFGVNVIREYGTFVDENTVEAGDTRITARRFVIATGSTAFVPPIPGLDQTTYFTNENIFDLRDKPDHLIVIGGGPIGLEMAQAHRRLGCKVTVLEGMRALGKDDPEIAEVALKNIRAGGVEIVEGAQIESVSQSGAEITVTDKMDRTWTGSHLLVAVGRRANIGNLNLEAAGIETTRAGIKVDASLKSTNRKVYAVGDAAGGLQFTHKAGYDAGIVIRSALFGLPAKGTDRHIPWATYTDPEIAQVGLTEEQAKKEHGAHAVEVLRFHFNENDRAIAEGKTDGLVKVMVVKGKVLGASIVGPQAGELIQLWALVIANKQKISAVANMVAPYPTLGEVNKRAAGQYYIPRLFESDRVKTIVGLVQKYLP
ncbi:pyruvate/2-oxoglutarate dehydrogenase complex dihydrolipoamide dehydrogenase (E3) component [Rubricella aquisinus]|uniref:Pyruvate/2-oxoglutarate dehydrogenase complex dihydrolipoamide dehydrogenase (E3) component n=1 Tax=Rubricella aquisinus TaxID=2028108 RepID=A0A840X8K9_9RHOB|nr:FAD-dependent oxidoreductase [Rubricella aquisinus]MBB5517057.1 pyruvate/2-oxoglutarate dehydrogenase complex dihydrolipoamide dehydrogenase (E3) component [Rubricella aquisinus]